jgi:hypothetical protein
LGFYDNDSTEERVCTGCNESWPFDSEFYPKPTSRQCRACFYERRREYRAKPDVKVKRAAAKQAYLKGKKSPSTR